MAGRRPGTTPFAAENLNTVGCADDQFVVNITGQRLGRRRRYRQGNQLEPQGQKAKQSCGLPPGSIWGVHGHHCDR